MVCDMCGGKGTLYNTIIEGAKLNVCQECSKFGRVVGVVKREVEEKTKNEVIRQEQEKEILDVVVEDFAEKIKNKREQLGLTQKDFAKKINEKESIIHKMEAGSFTPPLGLARKLGKFLKIKLIEQHEEDSKKAEKVDTGSLTIGDLIKLKKK